MKEGELRVKKWLEKQCTKKRVNIFLDVSKLIFGGVILAGVMNLEMDKFVLFSIGGFTVVLTIVVGLYLFKIGKE